MNPQDFRLLAIAAAFMAFAFAPFPLGAEQYKIRDIRYEIDGRTREYPLEKNLDIDRDRVFSSREEIEAFARDIEVKLLNQRVLKSGEVTVIYGDEEEDVVPADLLVKAADTFNYVLVPYPRFDSNDGLNLKLKFKDYNFFGSMEDMTADLVYEYDPFDETKHTVGANFSFDIPFKLFGEEFTWSLSASVDLPIGEPVDIDFSTTLGYERELIPARLELHAGLTQAAYVYPRDNHEELYPDDPYYLSNKLYVKFPVTVLTHSYFGDLLWTPQVSVTGNWAFGSITDDDLRGMFLTFSHSASFGRYDWVGNYRRGFSLSASNSWTYNPITTEKEIAVTVSATGYLPVLSFLGVYARACFMYDWESDGDLQVDMGSYMRGIIDERIETDMAFFFNIDLPVKVIDIDFERTTGIGWTRHVSFEAHISPFLDFGLTHDQHTGRYFSIDDSWCSGGLELVVFPDAIRSVYARLSVGLDLKELFSNGFDFGASAERDGGGIMEFFIGVGLEY